MTNSDKYDDSARRVAAESEALKALLDAELRADDPMHPNHIPMPTRDELITMARDVLGRTMATLEESEAAATPVSDRLLADVLASWSAELSLVSSTTRADTPDGGEGRLWKVRVTDLDLIASAFGTTSMGALRLTVSESPSAEGMAVSARLPLGQPLLSGVALVAVVDYGNKAQVRIALQQVDLGEAARLSGVGELSGEAVLPAQTAAAHPIITLSAVKDSQ